jgi:hypothetical protein
MNNRLFALFVIGFMGLLAFQEHQKPPKMYKVELPIEIWNHVMAAINMSKEALKRSDIPSKEMVFINDSLFSPIQTEFARQINEQLALEKKKADTTIAKPKKN